MPLSEEDQKVLGKFQDEYGKKQGERVFYASINAGKVKGIPEAKRMQERRTMSKSPGFDKMQARLEEHHKAREKMMEGQGRRHIADGKKRQARRVAHGLDKAQDDDI